MSPQKRIRKEVKIFSLALSVTARHWLFAEALVNNWCLKIAVCRMVLVNRVISPAIDCFVTNLIIKALNEV
jgi:hypothetical protein